MFSPTFKILAAFCAILALVGFYLMYKEAFTPDNVEMFIKSQPLLYQKILIVVFMPGFTAIMCAIVAIALKPDKE